MSYIQRKYNNSCTISLPLRDLRTLLNCTINDEYCFVSVISSVPFKNSKKTEEHMATQILQFDLNGLCQNQEMAKDLKVLFKSK